MHVFSFFSGRKNVEYHENLTNLATLVTEKIQFLTEGKDPVEPVQIMSIQVEVRLYCLEQNESVGVL